ncbi:hypothetical protein NPIL_265481, partial [Nephila pilipes]
SAAQGFLDDYDDGDGVEEIVQEVCHHVPCYRSCKWRRKRTGRCVWGRCRCFS